MERKPRVLLAAPLDAPTEQRLSAATVLVRANGDSPAALCQAIPGCAALIGRTNTRVSAEVLRAGYPTLRYVGVAGVGTDNVDIAVASELGIEVVSTPGAASDAVAELAVALMLLTLRPIPALAAQYAAGDFGAARRLAHGFELGRKRIGIVGMGRIGARVARICAAGFGCDVIYNDIVPVGPFDFRVREVDKPTLWREADIISLHVPLTGATERLVNRAVFEQAQPGTILINTCRGGVVATDDMVAALRSGRLAGAGLDVVDPEPLPPGHPLFALTTCIVTPHIAARTHEGLAKMFGIAELILERLCAAGS